jgi:hypothetical protein
MHQSGRCPRALFEGAHCWERDGLRDAKDYSTVTFRRITKKSAAFHMQLLASSKEIAIL